MYLLDDIELIAECYSNVETNFVVKSMIQGHTQAVAYVNDLERPSISVIWDKGHCLYFASNTFDKEQYISMIQFVKQELLTNSVRDQLGIMKVYYNDQRFESVLYDTLSEYEPLMIQRTLYRHQFETTTSMDSIEGITIREIGEDLFINTELKNLNLLSEEIQSMWGTISRFLRAGFGYCAIENQKIIGWCTAEYMSDDICGVGIETIETYQGRGIATRLTEQFIRQAEKTMSEIYWDSWKNNIPSTKVAEKAGFKLVTDYQILLARF